MLKRWWERLMGLLRSERGEGREMVPLALVGVVAGLVEIPQEELDRWADEGGAL